jgi:hypothetical protein
VQRTSKINALHPLRKSSRIYTLQIWTAVQYDSTMYILYTVRYLFVQKDNILEHLPQPNTITKGVLSETFNQCCKSASYWCRSGSNFPFRCRTRYRSGSYPNFYTCWMKIKRFLLNFFPFSAGLHVLSFSFSIVGVICKGWIVYWNFTKYN